MQAGQITRQPDGSYAVEVIVDRGDGPQVFGVTVRPQPDDIQACARAAVLALLAAPPNPEPQL